LARVTVPPRTSQRGGCGPAARRFAGHRGSQRGRVGGRAPGWGGGGVKIGQLTLGLPLDFGTRFPQLVGQFRAVARDVLQHHLEDEAGHRVEVAGESLAAQAQRLQRDRAAARERIHHQRRLLAVGGGDKRTPHIEEGRVGRVIPVGEIGDEFQESAAEVRIGLAAPAAHRGQQLARRFLESDGTVLIAGVGKKQRQ